MRITYVGGIRFLRHRRRQPLPSLTAPPPSRLTIALPTFDGCAAFPVVSLGDEVLCGTLLAASSDPRLAPIHAPACGQIDQILDPDPDTGTPGCIGICCNHSSEYHPACLPFEGDLAQANDKELLDFVEATGLVTSGSSFLSLAEEIRRGIGKVHTVLLSAVDDEPFASLGSHLLCSYPDQILDGMKLMLRLYGCRRGIAVVGDDQLEALDAIDPLLKDQSLISLQKVKPRYPISHERQLILSLFNTEQIGGKTLAELGYAVYTPDTLLALYRAFATGIPMIESTVLLDGDCLSEPVAITAPIGLPISALLRSCGRLTAAPALLARGKGAISACRIPSGACVEKNTALVLALSEKYQKKSRIPALTGCLRDAAACIACGKCLRACPSELDIPSLLAAIAEGKTELAASLGRAFCLGCGCCSYLCPVQIPIKDIFASQGELAHELSLKNAWRAPDLSEQAPAPASSDFAPDSALPAEAPACPAQSEALPGEKAPEESPSGAPAKPHARRRVKKETPPEEAPDLSQGGTTHE